MQLPQIVEAAMLLAAHGDLSPVQPDAVAVAAKPPSDRLNMHVLSKALGSGEVAYLACSLSGGAVPLNRIEQLFLCVALDPSCDVQDFAPKVWEVLGPQGCNLLHDGRPLLGDADNLAQLGRLAQVFLQKRLPLLKALDVLPGVARA